MRKDAGMSRAIVGKWGNNLAIRVPLQIARASGLSDGERVEIETLDGDILIRRTAWGRPHPRHAITRSRHLERPEGANSGRSSARRRGSANPGRLTVRSGAGGPRRHFLNRSVFLHQHKLIDLFLELGHIILITIQLGAHFPHQRRRGNRFLDLFVRRPRVLRLQICGRRCSIGMKYAPRRRGRSALWFSRPARHSD